MSRGQWHRWTAAENAELAKCWRRGLPLSSIAVRLGVNPWQCIHQRRRLGLPDRRRKPRRFSADEDALIIARWPDGPFAIARLIGRTPQAVSRHAIGKLGLPHQCELDGRRSCGRPPRRRAQ